METLFLIKKSETHSGKRQYLQVIVLVTWIGVYTRIQIDLHLKNIKRKLKSKYNLTKLKSFCTAKNAVIQSGSIERKEIFLANASPMES